MNTTLLQSRCCLLGGNANNGSNDGIVYLNANNSLDIANVNCGSQFCFKDLLTVGRCLLAKQLKTITALVGQPKKTCGSKAE